MNTQSDLWQRPYQQYQKSQSNLVLSLQDLQKLDDLILSDDIAHINNGLTLLCTLAPECLCRYLMLQNDQVSFRNLGFGFRVVRSV